jgi:hypothetical protein
MNLKIEPTEQAALAIVGLCLFMIVVTLVTVAYYRITSPSRTRRTVSRVP